MNKNFTRTSTFIGCALTLSLISTANAIKFERDDGESFSASPHAIVLVAEGDKPEDAKVMGRTKTEHHMESGIRLETVHIDAMVNRLFMAQDVDADAKFVWVLIDDQGGGDSFLSTAVAYSDMRDQVDQDLTVQLTLKAANPPDDSANQGDDQ